MIAATPALRPGLLFVAPETDSSVGDPVHDSCSILSHLLFFPPVPINPSGLATMIELTRLNGNRLAVNSDLIQYAESAPDTLLTMVTGEKLIVYESLAEVADRMAAYRARTLAEAARLSSGGLVFAAGGALQALASEDAINAAAQEGIDEESAGMMRRRRRGEP
jgi:flagellar protein FlbD